MTRRGLIGWVGLMLAGSASAHAQDVDLSADIADSCTLGVITNGVMTADDTGTIVGSEESGGSAASFTVVSTGASPTVTFGAPDLTSWPGGWSESYTPEIAYTSSDGADQDYTSLETSFGITGLGDSFTIHGRVTSLGGFAAGTYTLRTIVTCAAP